MLYTIQNAHSFDLMKWARRVSKYWPRARFVVIAHRDEADTVSPKLPFTGVGNWSWYAEKALDAETFSARAVPLEDYAEQLLTQWP